MKKTNSVTSLAKIKASGRKGFSLIELLVVIAVIGIIAAIAIPNIAGLTGGATDAKTQRNAQTIASVFSAARAAGHADPYATKELAVDAVVDGTGISVTNGANTSTFQVPNVSGPEKTAALAKLNLTGVDATGQLTYTP